MRRPSLSRALRLFGSGTGADPQCRLLWTGFLLPLSDAAPCRKDLDAVARASRTGPALVRTRDRRPAPADREAARVVRITDQRDHPFRRKAIAESRARRSLVPGIVITNSG